MVSGALLGVPPTDTPVVDLDQVAFRYGWRNLLNGVSLKVPAGEVFGILGAFVLALLALAGITIRRS